VFTPWILIAGIQLGLLSYAAMLFYAVLMGCAQAFVTPARDGLLNHVAQNNVQRTVLLVSVCQFGFQIIGYAIAGFADSLGAEPVLIVQSVVLLIGVIAYRQIRIRGFVQPHPHAAASLLQGVLQGVLEGAKTVFASPVMRLVVMQNVAMASFFMGCFIVCFPLVVREVFDGTSANLATLNGINSAGLVLTIFVMLRVGYVRRAGRALLVFQGLGAVALGISGMVGSFTYFALLVFVWGLCGGVAMPMSRTLMQELAPPAQRARVMSFYAFSFMGAGPFGTLFCGYLSEVYGPQIAIQISASLMLAVVIMMSLVSKLWQAKFEPLAEAQEANA
jgi:MFS family permease